MDTRNKYRVQPLSYRADKAIARMRLLDILNTYPEATIITNTSHYIHATFTTSILRFVDDVEFLFDATSQQIHVRSASRSGYYDFGVNARRVARLRTQFDALDTPR